MDNMVKMMLPRPVTRRDTWTMALNLHVCRVRFSVKTRITSFYFYHLLQVIEFPFTMKGFHTETSYPDLLTQWPCHLNLPSAIPVKMALYVPQSSILVW